MNDTTDFIMIFSDIIIHANFDQVVDITSFKKKTFYEKGLAFLNRYGGWVACLVGC